VDRFDDAEIDSAIWGTKVEENDTLITETGGELKFANAAGTAGLSYLPAKSAWGIYAIIEVKIQVADGEAAGDGKRCEASLHLYKDDDNYVKFGVYRDGVVNSSGYIRYNIDGAGEASSDLTAAIVDNDVHTFKIIKHESGIEFYYDNTYAGSFAFPELINYITRLEAGTEDAADTIDIRFDDFKLYNNADPFGTDLTGVDADLTTLLSRLSAARAGYLDYLNNGTYGLSAIQSLISTRLSAARAGYLDYLNDGTYGLSAIQSLISTRLSAARAGYLDNLQHYAITTGSGTLQISTTDMTTVEFTTATYGSVFELTFIADLDKATTGFDARGAASTILEISIWKEYAGTYSTLPQDLYAYQKDVTLDRNIDIDHVRCAQDTKIGIQLDTVPDTTPAEIPYTWIVRRLKT